MDHYPDSNKLLASKICNKKAKNRDKLKISGLTISQSKKAMQHFSRKENITAQHKVSQRWKSGIHLLVLVGADKSSAKLIRMAKSLSDIVGADLLALYLENTQILDEDQQEQLSKNIDLARWLGAKLVITSSNDFVSTALDIARKENITHIIIEKPKKQRFFSSLFEKDNFVNRLLKECGEIDVYIIGRGVEAKEYKKKPRLYFNALSFYNDYFLTTLAVVITLLFCFPLSTAIGYRAMSFILLFMILILSTVFRSGPVLSASVITAVAWNFFFMPPKYTLIITKSEDLLIFCMFFVVAFVTGTLTSKMHKQERLTRKREEKTNALFYLTNQLAGADNAKQIIDIAKEHMEKYFHVKAFFFLRDNDTGKLKKYAVKPANFSESEYKTAQWVFRHSKKAGKFTNISSSGEYTFYPLKGNKTKPGVAIIKMNQKFSGETELFWETFLTQISNALEHHYFAQSVQKASLLNESDKLYKTLFNSISHELRIPVAAIMGAADALLANPYPGNVKKELYGEILTASNRLNHLIENLLNMSRLETGKIAPHIDWCDINDLFNHVAHNLKDNLKQHRLDIEIPSSMPLVKLDIGLMEQVLYNLVYNSCKYADSGTIIKMKAFHENGYLIIQEMDRGPGFPTEVLAFVFDKFYKYSNRNLGGLGLGLSIAKGFVEAHKGTISVENRINGGVSFTIKIPTETSFYVNSLVTEQYEECRYNTYDR
ncbi:MAG: DUF4118 domain-containing protein [Dysgonamonadaceae bacterium]|nr:DUF4118 domain-containing protein [Dysgonamonadaceae bacterium]